MLKYSFVSTLVRKKDEHFNKGSFIHFFVKQKNYYSISIAEDWFVKLLKKCLSVVSHIITLRLLSHLQYFAPKCFEEMLKIYFVNFRDENYALALITDFYKKNISIKITIIFLYDVYSILVIFPC